MTAPRRPTSGFSIRCLALLWLLVQPAPITRAAGVPGDAAPPPFRRIVSMAPNVTEILFALGLADEVVGVTRYCDYPPEALTKAKVGGFYDPNLEAIVSLRPDLVILLANHREVIDKLSALHIRMLKVRGDTVDEVLETIETIGRICGRAERARTTLADMKRRMQAVAARSSPGKRPSVLVCIGRTLGVGDLTGVYIAGKDGFLDALVELAGGRNVYTRPGIRFPKVTREGIMELNPEVIVDLCADLDTDRFSLAEVRRDWEKVGTVAAVRNGRVHVLTEDFITIPGPRFVQLLEKLAEIIHPNAGPE